MIWIVAIPIIVLSLFQIAIMIKNGIDVLILIWLGKMLFEEK